MKQIVKKIARRILRNEIQESEKRQNELHKEILNLRENYFGKQEILLSKSIISGIVNMLPDPNKALYEPIPLFTPNGKPLSAIINNFRLVVREFYPEKYVRIEIEPLNMFVNIPHRKDTFNASVCGMRVAVDSYVYDLYQAGIREISDENFNTITNFAVSSVNVAKETGLLDYAK